MKSFSKCLTTLLLAVATVVTVQAAPWDKGFVILDHVQGLTTGDTVAIGSDLRFVLRYRIDTVKGVGISNGFRVYSPDGATWDSTRGDTIGWRPGDATPGKAILGKSQFDLMLSIRTAGIEGVGWDTVGILGVMMSGTGLKGIYNDTVFSITAYNVSAASAGRHICIDSSWFSPAGTWKWAGMGSVTRYPNWSGMRCFTVKGTPPPPGVQRSVTIDHVQGTSSGDTVPTSNNLRFVLRYRNDSTKNVGISNGFRVYSPDGALWDSTIVDSIGWRPGDATPGKAILGHTQFDLGNFLTKRSSDGMGADTVIIMGVMVSGTGLRGGFNDTAYAVTALNIHPGSEGKHICIDSSWFPPGGTWKWAGTGGFNRFPTWSGARCFTITGGGVTVDTFVATPDSLVFTAFEGGPAPSPKSFTVTEKHGRNIPYLVTGAASWLQLTGALGVTPGLVNVKASADSLLPGRYVTMLYIDSPRAPMPIPGLDNSGATPSDVATSAGTYVRVVLNLYSPDMTGLDVKITSLASDAFPLIYMRARVDSVGKPIFGLTTKDFVARENGVIQDSLFEVIGSADSVLTATDIVFVFDTTGSMTYEIASCKNNVLAFADSLNRAGVDYRLGLVTFGDSYSVHNSGNLFAPAQVADFRASIAALVASAGGDAPENDFDALAAATRMNFRPGAQKIFILITDAPCHYYQDKVCTDADGTGLSDNGNYTSYVQSTIVDLLKANNVTTYCVSPDLGALYPSYYGCYLYQFHGMPTSLADATGGTWYDVLADFRGIISDISRAVGSEYVVRYFSSTPVCDGMTREVTLTAKSGALSGMDIASYIPCMAPVVTVTPGTRNLEKIGQPAGTPITVDAWVVDRVPPYPSAVKLHVRRTGTPLFSEISMGYVSDSLWRAVIPGGGVVEPGVDYYVTATDGVNSGSAPATDPSLFPYQIAVLPNQPPVIIHTVVPTPSPKNVPVDIVASITDTTLNVASAKVYFRRYGDLVYLSLPMVLGGGATYHATIPAPINYLYGFEYFIAATDNYGLAAYHGTVDAPHQVNVRRAEEVRPTDQWISLYCDSLRLNGRIVTEGSVLSVYDPTGVLCGRGTVGPHGMFGFLNVYRDDPYTPDIDEGAMPGDRLRFTLNGVPVFSDVPIIWTANGDRFQLCWLSTQKCIPLKKGWNLISWNVDTPVDSITTVAAEVIPNVEVILGFEREGLTFDPKLPQFSKLLIADHLHGFWFKMKEDDTLCVFGPKAPVGSPIELEEGWNLASYLPDVTMTPDQALVSISGDLLFVYGYDAFGHKAYTPTTPMFNTLDSMKTTYGYWIKVSRNTTLVYPPGVATPGNAKQAGNQPKLPFVPTMNWVNTYSAKLTLNGSVVPEGTNITARAVKSGAIVGAGTVDANGKFGFMSVYATDISDAGQNTTLVPGEKFTLDVGSVPTAEIFTWTRRGDNVEVSGLTAKGSASGNLPGSFWLAQNYPNPFNPKTTILFGMPSAADYTLTIFNVTGQKVVEFTGSGKSGANSVEWDASPYASGIYFYRLNAGSYSATKKMMLLK